MRPLNLSIAIAISTLFSASIAFAWTGPTQTAPAGNVSAPINVGSTDQVKSASIGVNGLAVFGNTLLQAASYLNWGATPGSGGYGIRDNGGTLEFKNSTGSWSALGTGALTGSGGANYVTKFTGASALGNSIIYDTGSNVGIGAGATPTGKLEVRHSIGTDTEILRLRANLATWNAASYLTFVDDATGLVESQIKTELINGAPEIKRTLTLGTKEDLNVLNIYNGNVGVGTRLPTRKLEVNNLMKFSNSSADSNDGIIGTAPFAAGLNIVGINTDAAGRKINIWGSIIQNENAVGNTFTGTTNMSGAVVTNRLTVSEADGAYTYIVLRDDESTNGIKYIHANSNVIGFLSGAGGWLSYWDGSGNQQNVGNISAPGFLYSSDRRLKERIEPIADALSKTLGLSGVEFDWKSGTRQGQHDIGLIAQDVEKVLPEAVHTDEKGMKSVDYPKLTPLLINAIKEQQAQIERLEARIETLEAKK